MADWMNGAVMTETDIKKEMKKQMKSLNESLLMVDIFANVDKYVDGGKYDHKCSLKTNISMFIQWMASEMVTRTC
jgi:hypothetical protein